MKHRDERRSGRAIGMLCPAFFIIWVILAMTIAPAFATAPKKVRLISHQQLKSLFNDAGGKTRVIVLLSPT